MAYRWQGKWAPGVRYEIDDTVEHDDVGYICQHSHTSSASDWPGGPSIAWERLVKKHSAREDPFCLEKYDMPNREGKEKIRYKITIEEAENLRQIVYYDIHDLDTALKITARLNNAIYRWLAREVN